MNFIETMHRKAKEDLKKLVLPEGTEPRTLKAAEILVKGGLLSSLTLLGREEEIRQVAQKVLSWRIRRYLSTVTNLPRSTSICVNIKVSPLRMPANR